MTSRQTPNTTLPPTPQSTNMTSHPPPKLSSQELTFALPPPALISKPPSGFSPKTSTLYRPPSPPTPPTQQAPKKRRRVSSTASAMTTQTQTSIDLPPPPTRSRKIIQMKPADANPAPASSSASRKSASTKKNGPAVTTATPEAPSSSSSSSISPSISTDKTVATAATPANPETKQQSRKVARKTAHSLIERRRRSKMNEEFAVLKSMVPACHGVEMHKLAILQASIEYVRYLEGCVGELKKRQRQQLERMPEPPTQSFHYDDDEGDDEDDEDEGASGGEVSPLTTSVATSPLWTPHHVPVPPPQSLQRLPSISPLLYPAQPEAATAGAALLLLADEGRNSSVGGSARGSVVGSPGLGAAGTGSSHSGSRGMSVSELLSG